MNVQKERVDLQIMDPERIEEGKRTMELLFRLHQTMPMTEEYRAILKELFGEIGEGSYVSTPISSIACASAIHIGKNVYINGGCLFMARGGITIEDDVQIAANAQLISNNHDPYERQILTCKPVLIRQGAWIGAGATILPGVCVGKYAIVGAASVVAKDVPDYAVVVGNPARVVKLLDSEKFKTEKPVGKDD